MRANVLTRHGGPDALEFVPDHPDPQPNTNEVRIRVHAAGVNNTDLWTREGSYGSEDDAEANLGWRREPFTFPRIQGGDVCGIVDQVGPGVDAAFIGQRVLVDPVLYDVEKGEALLDARLIGSEVDGGFADYVVVPSTNAVPVATDLSDAELATFPISYLTAEHMLNRARVGGGERILVTGASGGVGSALLQLARLRGARVSALVSQSKAQRALELGAQDVAIRTSNLASSIEKSFGEQPFSVVTDVVGGPIFGDLLRLLRPEGRYVTAGAIAGPTTQLDLRTLYLKHLELIGSTMGTHEEFRELVRYIERGEVKPVLSRTFSLEELNEAQAAFREKQYFGKIAIQL